jgi:hypothetical protein
MLMFGKVSVGVRRITSRHDQDRHRCEDERVRPAKGELDDPHDGGEICLRSADAAVTVRRLPVHRRQDFCDDGHGGTKKTQPDRERKRCHLFHDFVDEGMQGENLRVSIRGHQGGSGGEMLAEKIARLLMEGL